MNDADLLHTDKAVVRNVPLGIPMDSGHPEPCSAPVARTWNLLYSETALVDDHQHLWQPTYGNYLNNWFVSNSEHYILQSSKSIFCHLADSHLYSASKTLRGFIYKYCITVIITIFPLLTFRCSKRKQSEKAHFDQCLPQGYLRNGEF